MRRLKKSSRRTQRPPRSGNRWLPAWSWNLGIDADRRGTVLIIVLALLGLLALLGVTFYTFANQEENNAEYYGQASKVLREDGISPDFLFDWSLKQIIMGAPAELRNSHMWGGRRSLMANMVGYDIHTYTGAGVKTMLQSNGTAAVDMNDNGQPDDGTAPEPDLRHLLNLTDFPGTQQTGSSLGQGALLNPTGTVYYPAPDVDYTYPDINNPYLAFKGHVLDAQKRPVFVVIPSYHRPQYLRTDHDGNPATPPIPIRDPSLNANTRAKVMRPHQDHISVMPDGTTPGTARRFLRSSDLPSFPTISAPFPFDIKSQGVWNMRRWTDSATFELGDWVIPSAGNNGYFYKCTSAGTSGGSEPTWSSSVGSVVNDNGISWTVYSQPEYAYDVDADGDGEKEAVYIDLDFPIQELGDGRRFVPLFALTIYDADGLVNLAAAGNMNGTLNLAPTTQQFGYDSSGNAAFLSRSNLGMTRGEINPQFVLNAAPAAGYPSDAFDQHQFFYSRTVNAGTPWVAMSNMEWWWLNVGRIDFTNASTINNLYEGRYGELSRLQSGWSSKNPLAFPWPGVSQADDSFQWPGGTGGNLAYGQYSQGHPFTWPLDFRGTGQAYNNKLPRTYTGTAPFRWPVFKDFSTGSEQSIGWRYGVDGLASGPYNDNASSGLQNILMETPNANAGTDDPAELNADPKLTGRNGDSNYGPSHNAFLQASATDLAAGRVHSLLGELAPFNLRVNDRAEDIRQRLTTTSYDLRTRSNSFDIYFDKRTAERRNTGTVYEFPPPWGTGYGGDGSGRDADPFRPELRKLLGQQFGERNQNPDALQQRKLSLNHVMDRSQPTGNYQLVSRDLTEHPESRNLTLPSTAINQDPAVQAALSSTYGQTVFPVSTGVYSGNPALQEYYARRDRQLLARDIYTLLYFFCGGQDGNSPFTTSNSSFTVHTEAQLEEMAQFAINYVNALDRDHVMDRFEYDVNLQNGWDVDDDPYGTTSDGGTERRQVDGVETQQLSLSEVLAVHALKVEQATVPYNHPATEWNDEADRYFTYIEMRNPSPYPVTFNEGVWRLEVEPKAGGSIPDTLRRLTLKQGTVASGGLFTILSAGDDHNQDMGVPRASYMKVAPEYDMADMSTHTPRLIIPFAAPNASEKLDLITDQDMSNTKFVVTDSGNSDGGGTPFRLMNASNVPLPNQELIVRLQRRMSLNRTAPLPTLPENDAANRDNPWITVDEISLTGGLEQLALQDMDDKDDIPAKLDNLNASYRRQPFSNPNPQAYISTGAPNYQANTLGGSNTPTSGGRPAAGPPDTWDHYQIHFNRPLSSPVELFSIPLYGPEELLENTHWRGQRTAGALKFLRPNGGTGMPINDNRWYRLLSFVEVMDWGLSPGHFRTAGKINWNTIRHPEVWAALLDDAVAFNQFLPLIPANKQTQYLVDASGETARDWWWQFVGSRDRLDSITDMLLPGMPSSKPFHSFNYLNGNQGIESTMFRQLPEAGSDTPGANEIVRRRLLELRNRTEFNDSAANGTPAANSQIDHYTRHRLLSKALNNSTTRSNVFFVFVQVDYFEAVVDTNGVTRIGGKLAESPAHRGFFVLDRTLGLEELRAADFKTSSDPDYYTLRDSFDFRSVIVHRQLLD